MIISGNTIDEIYLQLLSWLLVSRKIAPRGRQTRELLNPQLRLGDARANVFVHPVRDLNYRFMIAEWLWVLFGLDVLEPLARYNSRMREFSDDGVTLAGAYGTPFSAQLSYVLERLRADTSTRQAVITFWRPTPPASRDVSCTISLQFLVRDGRLHLTTNMRSSDAWLGVPYDVFTLTMLQNAIAALLNELDACLLDVGTFTLNIASSHLYEEHWESADRLVTGGAEAATLCSPRLIGAAPRELKHLLLNPETVLRTFVEPTWAPYARVLRCPGKTAALQILTEVDRVAN